MPLSHYPEEQERIGHAHVGAHTHDDLGFTHAYDAVHDREAMAVYLDAFAATPVDSTREYGGLTFHRVGGHDLDTEAHSTLFSGEQSNSSVAFGEDSLLKVFRKVTPGRNPDIEIHKVLTEAENHNVAALYGWIESGEDDLGMIQQFLRTASDGWDIALASVRNLFAEADLHADEVGGDFAGEAERLGAAVADVHSVCASTSRRARSTPPRWRPGCGSGSTAGARSVPALETYAAIVNATSTGWRGSAPRRSSGCTATSTSARRCAPRLEARRLRGRARQAAARADPARLAWRDVGGHAAVVRLRGARSRRTSSGRRRRLRAAGVRCTEWSARNRDAFLSGYLGARRS